MGKLTREIANTEKAIRLDNQELQQEFRLLNQRIKLQKVLPWVMLSGFVGGYYFARKKTFSQVLQRTLRFSKLFL